MGSSSRQATLLERGINYRAHNQPLGGSSQLRGASDQSHMPSVRWDGVRGLALPKDILISPKEKQRSEAQRGSGPGPGLPTQTAAILQLQAPDEVLENFKINVSK